MEAARKGNAKFTIKVFKEKVNKLNRDIKETEDSIIAFNQATVAARRREYAAKQRMKEIAEKISDCEEQIGKIENRIAYHGGRSQEITEKYRENDRVLNSLESTDIDLDQMMRELRETQEHRKEVQRMNRGLRQVMAALEPKIEKAEQRNMKATDRAFLIRQKLTVHYYLAAKRPDGFSSSGEDIIPQTDQEAKILQLREKIKGAILRWKEAEKKKSALEEKIKVMAVALDNYMRRNLEFHVTKRELLSSNFY